MSDEGTTVWVPDETYEVRKKATPEEGQDYDPDKAGFEKVRAALIAMSRGENHRVGVGPPWGMTPEQWAARHDEVVGSFAWAALATCAGFADYIARERGVTLETVLAGYRMGLPEGFSGQMSIAPTKFVKGIRTALKDHNGRITMTVDE